MSPYERMIENTKRNCLAALKVRITNLIESQGVSFSELRYYLRVNEAECLQSGLTQAEIDDAINGGTEDVIRRLA